MNGLLLLVLLAAAEPKLELRGPARMGEPPAGTPPVLYTGEPEKQDDSKTHRLYFVAGAILIAIAIYLTTRPRKPPSDEEPGHE